MDKFKYKLDVTMNCDNPWYQVPEKELNKRIVGEICYVKDHRLTFQNIPKVMIIYLAFELVRNFIFSSQRIFITISQSAKYFGSTTFRL